MTTADHQEARPHAAYQLSQAGRLWRQGRSVGRTIYVMVGDEPSKDDLLIGVMDSPGLAAVVVDAVNTAGRRP
jgi:hypothetical protein